MAVITINEADFWTMLRLQCESVGYDYSLLTDVDLDKFCDLVERWNTYLNTPFSSMMQFSEEVNRTHEAVWDRLESTLFSKNIAPHYGHPRSGSREHFMRLYNDLAVSLTEKQPCIDLNFSPEVDKLYRDFLGRLYRSYDLGNMNSTIGETTEAIRRHMKAPVMDLMPRARELMWSLYHDIGGGHDRILSTQKDRQAFIERLQNLITVVQHLD